MTERKSQDSSFLHPTALLHHMCVYRAILSLSVLCSTVPRDMWRLPFWGARTFLSASSEGTDELEFAFKLQVLQRHRECDQCNQVKHVPGRNHKYEFYRSDRARTRSADSQWLCSKTKNITEGRVTNLRWHERGKRWYVMRLLSSSPVSSLKKIKKGRGKKALHKSYKIFLRGYIIRYKKNW